ncbi:hypothetical protein GCM10009730_53740 [Streptomyces albidochromogenes]
MPRGPALRPGAELRLLVRLLLVRGLRADGRHLLCGVRRGRVGPEEVVELRGRLPVLGRAGADAEGRAGGRLGGALRVRDGREVLGGVAGGGGGGRRSAGVPAEELRGFRRVLGRQRARPDGRDVREVLGRVRVAGGGSGRRLGGQRQRLGGALGSAVLLLTGLLVCGLLVCGLGAVLLLGVLRLCGRLGAVLLLTGLLGLLRPAVLLLRLRSGLRQSAGLLLRQRGPRLRGAVLLRLGLRPVLLSPVLLLRLLRLLGPVLLLRLLPVGGLLRPPRLAPRLSTRRSDLLLGRPGYPGTAAVRGQHDTFVRGRPRGGKPRLVTLSALRHRDSYVWTYVWTYGTVGSRYRVTTGVCHAPTVPTHTAGVPAGGPVTDRALLALL